MSVYVSLSGEIPNKAFIRCEISFATLKSTVYSYHTDRRGRTVAMPASERSAISLRSTTATWLSGAVLGRERVEGGSREKFPNHPHHNLGCPLLRHSGHFSVLIIRADSTELSYGVKTRLNKLNPTTRRSLDTVS